ncbi:MAG: L-histidine N(alpha)-methyltransferase [Acidobacteriaceae bacterium]|nr:L-histidine N(alpha)-methyltransferase [Acidobacteriaceae bacterium]
MAVYSKTQLSKFALDVVEGLSRSGQKTLPSRHFYDNLGSALFEAITMLPEYGLTRADERLLYKHAADLAFATNAPHLVAELGSGSGRKTRFILRALADNNNALVYRPIDVSSAALSQCEKELCDIAEVRPVHADWLDGLKQITSSARQRQSLLLLFLGSSIGNIDRQCIPDFLQRIRMLLNPGDFFLLGADLLKDVDTMLAAYDDTLGVTAAFNLNILRRVRDELGADLDLRSFAHEARWNEEQHRIEMHLLCCKDQIVHVRALEQEFRFRAGETIWTESSHKFTEDELNEYARVAGFTPAAMWVDAEWPFAEALWSI